MAEPLLSVRDLVVTVRNDGAALRILDGVSFSIGAGESLGIVGESGSGKTMTALAIMRLFTTAKLAIASGEIMFEGQDLTLLSERGMRSIRGARIAMIFQEATAALNPVYTIGNQIVEVIRAHERVSSKAAHVRAVELLRKVRMPDPTERVNAYPHQLSGGMCQRAMIAIALACNPRLLIADEPTTALDVTVQAQIMELLSELRESEGMSLLLITHDLGVVAQNVDRVAVMYAGRIVEEAAVVELFQQPLHPYAKGLLASVPHAKSGESRRARLQTIAGSMPRPGAYPSGCRFHDRCPERIADCPRIDPPLVTVGSRRFACIVRERELVGPRVEVA